MRHLFVCREYPPFPYPPGGIATYVDHMARWLVAAGDSVQIVAQMWPGAPRAIEELFDGRLVIRRLPLDEPIDGRPSTDAQVLRGFKRSAVPVQAFGWQVARLLKQIGDQIDVIESPEYEAPLYHYLRDRRRAPSPDRLIPAIVHLHSPSECLYRYNDWDSTAPDFALLTRMEEYTILSADALLCPSRFLAQGATQRYNLEPASVEILPYPLGQPIAPLERDAETWESGWICYIGRLERRKGVFEWVDAAVSVAAEDPAPRFLFVGGDPVAWGTGGTSIQEQLLARIPTRLRDRFDFHGPVPRERLPELLRAARIAVVPSLWENFPNTCMEAMSSGLPVLISPSGGMAEMVTDGETGWIASAPTAGDIAATLRRALGTAPSRLEEMGTAAGIAIRRQCDNQVIGRAHRDLREQVWRETAALGLNRVHADALDRLEAEIDAILSTTAMASVQPAHTMTPADILRAPWRQRVAALRRAAANPKYVLQWLRWHSARSWRQAGRVLRAQGKGPRWRR